MAWAAAMLRRAVAGLPLQLTEIGLGGGSLGNLYTAISDEQAQTVVHTAWARGIRYFDTAPHYGLGLSERRLGQALKRYPRDEYVLSTKVGRLLVDNPCPRLLDDDHFAVAGNLTRRWDFSRDGIRRSVEQSLNRVGVDRFDVLYLHDPDLASIPDAALTGAAALIELRDEGLVTAVGIGSNSSVAVTELFRQADIDIAMIAGRFSVLEQRGADEVFEAAAGRAVVAAGVFNSGILASIHPKDGAKYNYRPVPDRVLSRARHLAELAESHGATLPQVSIAFPLRNPAVTSVVLGMKSAAEVETNMDLALRTTHENFWRALSERPD